MNKHDLLKRTKAYALRVITVVESLPASQTGRIPGGRLLLAGTSVGASYRAVCRAISSADFLTKLKIMVEECDESLFWMELLVEGGIVPLRRLERLLGEGNELLSIFVSAIKTSRAGGAS